MLTLSTLDTNQDINLTPHGTGVVVIGGSAPTIRSITGVDLSLGTLDGNKDVVITPHGTGVLRSNTLKSKASSPLALSTEDSNQNISLTPHGTGIVQITKSQDATGGSGYWVRSPQMTTAEANTMTSGWGASDAGKRWFDTTTRQEMMWDGTQQVILG
jgi:hypothetical protein